MVLHILVLAVAAHKEQVAVAVMVMEAVVSNSELVGEVMLTEGVVVIYELEVEVEVEVEMEMVVASRHMEEVEMERVVEVVNTLHMVVGVEVVLYTEEVVGVQYKALGTEVEGNEVVEAEVMNRCMLVAEVENAVVEVVVNYSSKAKEVEVSR